MFDVIVEPGRHTGVDFTKKTFANFLNIHSSPQFHPTLSFKWQAIRTYLKIRVLVQDRGRAYFQTGGILLYVEDLKIGINKDIGPKDIFEMRSAVRRD
jgi:hypothetical protein